MVPVLKANSLFKKFGNLIAVDHISFEVCKGEILGFLGPNGAGKTTTIRMLSGLLKPDGGSIEIGSDRNEMICGICPQHIVIWENLTTIEQVIYMGIMYNMPLNDAREKGTELLGSLGLSEVKDRLAKNLSGGMQRRLNIALALVHSPEIVFLDEPQAGLDPQSRVLVRDYIREIKNKTTVVLTTHDMEEAEKLSDRICIIDNGRLLISGTSDEIKKKNGFDDLVEINIEGNLNNDLLPFLSKEIIGNMTLTENTISVGLKDPIPLIENILQVAKDHHLKITSLRLRKTSLEDIFLKFTGRRLRE